jgi:outer membrane protein assembly complex protein YaeT
MNPVSLCFLPRSKVLEGMTNHRLAFALVLALFWSANLFSQDVRIDDFEFHGNDKVSSGRLFQSIETQSRPWYGFLFFWSKPPLYDEDVFLSDLLRIEKYYQKEGYFNAKVTDYKVNPNKQENKVKILVDIEEGKPTYIDTVSFVYEKPEANQESVERLARMMSLKKGVRYREDLLREDYNKLISKFNNGGYPHIKVRVKMDFDQEKNLVDLHWMLDTGTYSYFGDITYSGNKSISNSVIRRGLGFRPGQPFEQKKLIEAQSQVYRLELFQFVSLRTEAVDSSTTRVPVEVKVRESVLRTLKFGTGYDTVEKLRLSSEFRNRNFLGGGRILRLRARRSQILPVELELELSQPYFLSNRNDLILKPSFRRKNEPAQPFHEALGVEASLVRQLTDKTNAFLTMAVSKNLTYPQADSISRYSLASLRFGMRRSTTNELFNPTDGTISSFVFENALPILQNSNTYRKIFGEHRIYTELDKNTVFAMRVFAGTMAATGQSQATPLNERFFSGGPTSIRGWALRQVGPDSVDAATGRRTFIGGNSAVEGNLELRRSLYKQLSGALFLDYGNIWEIASGFDFSDLRYSIGAGLRYNTPIGPARIDLAYKLNKQFPQENNLQFHLSIGQAF